MSNTEQKQKILLKRTTEVDKQPIPSGASHGELFLNIASGANAHNKIATMQIGTDKAIIWSDDVANEKKFVLKTELENLIQEVEDSEFVTANALTQINKSAGFTEGGSSVLEGGMSLSEAIIDLQARAGVIEESDPIFAKSAASGITSADITNWNNKMDFVDRVSSAFTSYSATTSTKAIQDGDGNVITTTYSTKAELSGAVNNIIEEIIDNELVTSTAISTMNASAGFNEDGTSALPNKQSLTDAIVELQGHSHDKVNSATTSVSATTAKSASTVTNRVPSASTSYSAITSTKAIQDGDGQVITSTYSKTSHTHNASAITGGTFDIARIPTGTSSTTVARGDHSHTAAEVGLESALKYHGVTTSPLSDGATTRPITIGGVSHYQSAGCVVIYSTTASGSTEFVWNGNKWEKLGDGINYKVKQEAVSDPAANGSALTFIDTISQDVNGKITVTKKNIPSIGEMNVQSDWSETDTNSDAYIKNKPTIPTKLSQLTDDVVAGKYLPQSKFQVAEVADPSTVYLQSGIYRQSAALGDGTSGWAQFITLFAGGDNWAQMYFSYDGKLHYRTATFGDGDPANIPWKAIITEKNIKDQYVAGVYDSYNPLMKITFNYAGDAVTSNPAWLACWNGYTLSYVSPDNVKAGRATKLQTPRKLWGNDFDGTADVSGNLYSDIWRIVKDSGTGGVFFQAASYNNLSDSGIVYITGRNGNDLLQCNIWATKTFLKGNVGIGTTSPTERLDVSGNVKATTFKGNLQGNADSATTAKSASTISAVTGTGQYYLLGHSTTGNGSYSVYKNSNVYMNNGSIFAASDRTLKTHIEDIDGSLDKIKKIPKVYFHWNNDEDKKRQMGTYAQDLEEVYPELVTKDKDGIRAVAYDRLGVVALAGIDKLYDMVQELMKKNDELEKRIKELEENK